MLVENSSFLLLYTTHKCYYHQYYYILKCLAIVTIIKRRTWWRNLPFRERPCNNNNNKDHPPHQTIILRLLVCIVIPIKVGFKSHVMNVPHTFAMIVIGVMNFKPITRYECVIDAMAFIVGPVMKWINAMIVGKWFVEDVPLY